MLQLFKNKKARSLNEQLLISNTWIISSKINLHKKSYLKLKSQNQIFFQRSDENQLRKIYLTPSTSKQKRNNLFRPTQILEKYSQQKYDQSNDQKQIIFRKKSKKKSQSKNKNGNKNSGLSSLYKTQQHKLLQLKSNVQMKKVKQRINSLKNYNKNDLQQINQSLKKLPKIDQKAKSNKNISFNHHSLKRQIRNSTGSVIQKSEKKFFQKNQNNNQNKIQIRQFVISDNKMRKSTQRNQNIFQKQKKQDIKYLSNHTSVKKPKVEALLSLKQIKSNNSIKLDQIKKTKQKNQKLKIIRDQFQMVINKTNFISVNNQNSFFIAYIEKGNNGMLVRQILKRRWWWHIADQKPCQSEIPNQLGSKLKKDKKINLFWTQWMNKSFIQSLQIQDELHLKTIYDQYKIKKPEQQPKLQLIKKISGDQAFNQIKDKISFRKINYFKNFFPKPIQIQGSILKNSQKNIENKYKKLHTLQNELNPINENFKFVNDPQNMKIHNHLFGGLQLHSKKLLFKNLSKYLKKKNINPFQYIPLTFYIQDLDSQNYQDFLLQFDQITKRNQSKTIQNIWILKPGQNSNRGFGITVHKQKQQIHFQLLKRLAKNKTEISEIDLINNKGSKNNNSKKSVIVQKYIQNCFLINKRKFDIRSYILITTVNGYLKGYWYQNAYIRTSSEEYDLKDTSNVMIHLTNQAIQCKNNSYGKFQDYNKLDLQTFIKYLTKLKIPMNQFEQSMKTMKLIAYYLIASVSTKIKRYQYTFQLFGLDFMLDENLKPLLIQANSNPCLDTKGPVLTKIVRQLVQNVFITAIDPLYPPPSGLQEKRIKKEQINTDYFQTNKFQLIFSEKII